MAANITIPAGGRPTDIFGSRRVATPHYVGPNPYLNAGTPGDPILAADLGLRGITGFPSFHAFDPVGGLFCTCVYDSTLEAIRWFVGTTGVEVANGVDLSAYSADIVVYG